MAGTDAAMRLAVIGRALSCTRLFPQATPQVRAEHARRQRWWLARLADPTDPPYLDP